MKFLLMLFLIFPFTIHSVDLQDILSLHIPEIGYFIKSGEAMIKKEIRVEQSSALIPNISFGNSFNYLGLSNNFETLRLRESASNTIGLSFTISPGALYRLASKEKPNQLELNTAILSLYSDMVLNISEAKDLVKNMAFKKDYRKALTDYKQQIAEDEVIFNLKKEIIRKYQEILKQQFELYGKAGININYEKGKYNYQYEMIEKIIIEE